MTPSTDGSTPPLLVTLLDAAGRGDRDAFDRAFALLYDELSMLARSQRRKWQGNDTMSTSVLVHEAYLKLLSGGEPARWDGRRHFFALAAQVMRQVLVNYAEGQRAAKRGGEAERVPIEHAEGSVAADIAGDDGESILSLHEALQRLAAENERQARIVECRFFAGLSIPETAEALGISPATVKREWQAASGRLHRELAASLGPR
jgi:RNA polymerase sigma factor (TIGR02999 family)